MPSSRVLPICEKVVVAHVVPPSRDTAASRSVLRANPPVLVWMASRALLGVVVAVKVREAMVMLLTVVEATMTMPEPPAPPFLLT